MATSINVKLCVSDLAPLHIAHPSASRSGIVRALIYAVASLDGPLPVAGVESPRAALWTSISVDVPTEVLVGVCFAKNNAKHLSALIYHAVRDPRVLETAKEFLSLSEGARKRRVEALVLASTGQALDAVEEDRDADAEAPTVVLSYLLGEVARTEREALASQKAHDAAKKALLAYRRALGDDRTL